MFFSSTLTIASTLAAVVLASPVPTSSAVATPTAVTPELPRLAFSVNQQSKGKKLKTWPAKQVLATFHKFKKTAPAQVKSAAASAQTGSVVSNPTAYDEEYISPVTVGGKTLNLDFDTGSSDLWVYSDLLSTATQKSHNVYNTSSGVLKDGYSWQIVYGDGSGASGKVYADKVQVGAVTATAQAVEAATSVSTAFAQDTNSDGLLGLAFSAINTVEPTAQSTFFDTVKASLAAPLFTAKLKTIGPGTYDFGYIDSTKYTGNITYVDVDTTNGFWQFTSGGYKVGNKAAVNVSLGTGILDTGTTLLYLPPFVVNAYYKQVIGAVNNKALGGWVFPCTAVLPALTLSIGNGTFVIPGSLLNYSPVTTTKCFGSLQPNTGIGFSIFGDVFLRAVFAVFDQTQATPRLGFAKQS